MSPDIWAAFAERMRRDRLTKTRVDEIARMVVSGNVAYGTLYLDRSFDMLRVYNSVNDRSAWTELAVFRFIGAFEDDNDVEATVFSIVLAAHMDTSLRNSDHATYVIECGTLTYRFRAYELPMNLQVSDIKVKRKPR